MSKMIKISRNVFSFSISYIDTYSLKNENFHFLQFEEMHCKNWPYRGSNFLPLLFGVFLLWLLVTTVFFKYKKKKFSW